MSKAEFDEREKYELLAGRALGDLSEAEFERVESILVDNNAKQALWDLEKAAALVHLAPGAPTADELPGHVADRIRRSADETLGMIAAGRMVEVAAPPSERSEDDAERRPGVGGVTLREMVAWFCAAAALVLAIWMWSPSEPDRPAAAAARTALLASSPNAIRVDWTAGKTPFDQPVTGDVVWDPDSQTGFMRFNNMPANDPTVEQYQLWIIDPLRDDEPIDGGVFDITDNGEVVIPIDAKLAVIEPAAFAITIEKPGGVVVSTQDRLPLLAPVEG